MSRIDRYPWKTTEPRIRTSYVELVVACLKKAMIGVPETDDFINSFVTVTGNLNESKHHTAMPLAATNRTYQTLRHRSQREELLDDVALSHLRTRTR